MKIKGLKSTVKQVTFEGDKHPTCGVVSTFTWDRIANHLAYANKTLVRSIEITSDGLRIYWDANKELKHTPMLSDSWLHNGK